MSGSTDATVATPAWKKLGLKLKHSNANEATNGTPAVGQPDRAQQGSSMQGKRKLHTTTGAASDYSSSPLSAKKPRRDFSRPSTGDATPQLTRKKSVAFADTPTHKTAAPGSTTARKTPAKPLPKAAGKTGKGLTTSTPPKKQKQKKPQPTADTRPALEYLRHWVSSRDSWKFNKNHQSTLIKAIFESGIPPADVGSFYDYIDDIKGAVRMRLRETALAIRLKDDSDRAAAFPEGTADPDGKQGMYEAALAGFLETQQKAAASKKRTFAEVDYVTTAQDADVIIRRLVKRMRAEMVIATLSDGDETDASTTTVKAPVKSADADAKPNGVAGKRRRKLRTNVDDSDDTSSSSDSSSDESDDSDSDEESDAGSGSDTSSSSSSDDSSEDEAEADEDMDDDSSSSSSSSDDDSDDEDSDDEADATAAKTEKTSK
ncbi:hypothetical protein ISF_06958 [Cordyceps fumosorosea ARSEF 2679]|uniref:WKF domain-containing protein n=1 Tax=Cordyceps fumosorosea (strain ARSEF 2679) TaxID=1081104 RepID=A0A167QK84_CORFA|nr:hypothetical protein ISF_06958 [Cordyceps fumosorosea ARSEF 2679]OAA57717.1 hypothetical protein ISF_06958 [Cordyceps fumosorosea ARSEF 2679]